MNTPGNAVAETSLESQAAAPAAISPGRLLYWLVRRELWENRSIYIAPLAVAALLVLGHLISTLHLPETMRGVSALDPVRRREIIGSHYDFGALLIMGTSFIVGIFYCLDALHGERRDRSILFWKSLPVSDLMTVLSKASIPVVVLPLLTFAITVVTQVIMLLLSSIALVGSGVSVATLWSNLPLFHMWLTLLYHLVAIHGLYYAPIWGWLLLVSAWARRATFLWAALPPLAISVVEKIAFNTTHFATMLGNRISGGGEPVSSAAGRMSMDTMPKPGPGEFLSSPGLWIGLLMAAGFLAAAVRMRRYREPI